MNEIIIECKRIKFFSTHDEYAFFDWIKKSKCIANFKGIKDKILLIFDNKEISKEELHELIALFRRYKINKKQLEVFLNEENKDLFYRYQECFSINVYPAQQVNMVNIIFTFDFFS